MGQEKSDADAEILSTHLCSYSLDNSWEIMVLPLTMLHPGSEITHFAIVTRVCEPHFGPDQEDLSVVDDHPAIVDDIFVDDRPDKVVSMVHVRTKSSYMPTSQTISVASVELRILARTSHEWRTVSPARRAQCLRDGHRHCISPSRK